MPIPTQASRDRLTNCTRPNRMQVWLSDTEYKILRKLSRLEDRPMAGVLRQALYTYIQDYPGGAR